MRGCAVEGIRVWLRVFAVYSAGKAFT
ncbi:hypothetical protein MC885_002982 [Smutsia gigantea]|nr:hypothetical protein MC885_002982 [Smutsia gigantea]